MTIYNVTIHSVSFAFAAEALLGCAFVLCLLSGALLGWLAAGGSRSGSRPS